MTIWISQAILHSPIKIMFSTNSWLFKVSLFHFHLLLFLLTNPNDNYEFPSQECRDTEIENKIQTRQFEYKFAVYMQSLVEKTTTNTK